MANDEPPYLNVGTDVSAKYKGAFCEAKIKKVNRVVKCKVTFKNNLGSFMVTDDLIKGPLRIGADIEAKHPEKNAFLEAVINKLQDYSQYTVVFDDGDETTLRRTSLCLKSGRHFAESPTLDQFPLTNPEHFGTPVIGAGKYKRKRRSTMNSMDYDSDEESFPRKLKAVREKEKDPDLGKVVIVDFGDRRKKDSWYPGIIMPNPSQANVKIPKEEFFIRSFKDGKYYQLPRRDTREFKEQELKISKIENSALKTAVEKALAYIEKEELPSHWAKALFISLESASADEYFSQDSDLDTSDDEPSEDKDRFVAQLYKFMDERGTPINKAPTVSNKDLNLHKLFKITTKFGGFNRVTNQNKWKTVYSKMGLPPSNPNGPNQLKSAYKRYLQSFEDFNRKLGCTMVNNSRSTRGRHRSDRNFILTRTRDREATASPKGRSSKDIKDAKDKADKKEEKKVEEKPRTSDKKDVKVEEEQKNNKVEEKPKSLEKKKSEKSNIEEKDDKQKKEERPRLARSQSLNKEKKIGSPKEDDKKDNKTEKARTREDARKEKNESPEKKGTRSSLKMEMEKKEKEEAVKEMKEKKDVSPTKKEKKEEKPLKDIKEEKLKDKKDEKTLKERKINKDKKITEKATKDKGECSLKEKNDEKILREKRDSSKDEKIVKGRKEESKVEEKAPLKKKLDRLVKEKKEEKIVRPRRENKSPLPESKKNDEVDSRSIKDEKIIKNEVESKKEEISKEKPGPKLRERQEDTPCSEETDDIDINVFDDKETSQDEMDRKGPGQKLKEDNEEPPNKGKKRSLKLQDEKDPEDALSDSDDDDQDKSMKDMKNYEIVLGDRVKVKYGRGRLKKVYDAKVLKIQNDGPEKRYFVHYNGWNNRYDEWVKRSFIVALASQDSKQPKDVSQKTASVSLKRVDRGRPPGPINQTKPARKNSTSSTNSSLSSSRATRSDKKNLQSSPLSSGLGPKKRVRRKSGVTGLTDTSQDSDSDENDLDDLDDDVGDADIEDNTNTQNDSCFKEELFSDDEEKEKLEDVKRDDISELEKSIPLEENSEYIKDSFFNPIKTEMSKSEPFLKVESVTVEEPTVKIKEEYCSNSSKEYEKSEIKSVNGKELTVTSPSNLSLKLTITDIRTVLPEKQEIQQPETVPQKCQLEVTKTSEKDFKPQLIEKTFKPLLEFKTESQEKTFKPLLEFKTESQEKTFKPVLEFKTESPEISFKTQLSETVTSSTSSDKICKPHVPEKFSKTIILDNESKILKIQIPNRASKMPLISEKKPEKIPIIHISEKTAEVKINLPGDLKVSNTNKSIIKSAEINPVNVPSEIKPDKTIFLSVPSKTPPLINEQNKKNALKSSIIPISHPYPENKDLTFSGLHGLIHVNSNEKNTPLNRNIYKDILFKPEVPKPILNQPPKIEKLASESKNISSMFKTEKVPLFTSNAILNPPKLSESLKVEEKPVLKSTIFNFPLKANDDKDQPKQLKTLDSPFKLLSNLQKDKEKSEQKNDEPKLIRLFESSDKKTESVTLKKSVLGNPSICSSVPECSEPKTEKIKDDFDLLVESSKATPKKITDNKDNAFSLSFPIVTSKEKSPDQQSNKIASLSNENLCYTKPKRVETFDLSKTIPSILERLKKDVAADVKGTESPPPPKEELNFNFLRGSQDTTKSLSRSESSNSLRICEDTSDTNESNTDSKDLIINEKFSTSSVVSSSASDNAVPYPSENLQIQPPVTKSEIHVTERTLNSTFSQNIIENEVDVKNSLKTSVITPSSNKSPSLSNTTEQESETTSDSSVMKDDNLKEVEKKVELSSSKIDDAVKIETVAEVKKDIKSESENSLNANREVKSESLTEIKSEETSNSTKSEKSNDAKPEISPSKDSLFDDLLKIKNTSATFSQSGVIMWNSETKDTAPSDKKPVVTSAENKVSVKETSFSSISDLEQPKISKFNELPIIQSKENSAPIKNEENDLDSIDTLKESKSEPDDEIQDEDVETSLLSKKELKKKRLSKKLKRFGSSEGFDRDEKESKIKDGKNKSKKRKFENDDFEDDFEKMKKIRDLDLKLKSKKLKKNKNKKRLAKLDDIQGEHKKGDGDDDYKDIYDKLKKKEKKKCDKKFFKSGIKGDFSESKIEIKKKKGKKNRDKLSGDKKDFLEKKAKKKKKTHIGESLDTDSEKDVPHKSIDKKKKKDRKKFKTKDSSSSDEASDKFFKDQNKNLCNLPTSSNPLMRQDSKSDDPDMSFLLCEEKVPASPVGISNMADDTSGSSSLDDNRSNSALDILPLQVDYPGIENIESSDTLNKHSIDTHAVMDNTPPTTPSSTESLLSSSPSHERDSFSMNYPESTQSGRDSGEGESDIYRCNSNRTIVRGSDEYHAATTLAFAVCKSVSEKPKEEPSQNFLKRQKSEADEHTPSKRKKKSKRVRRCSESAKSPRHKSSFSRLSKFESCCEDSSGASPATYNSPPYSNTSINFSRSPHRLSCSSESYSRYNNFYVHLHEKDPEKRIALLQEKMAALRKEYMELRSKFIALDHKRRRARKKMREAGAANANPSAHTEDGQSCS